MVRLNVRSCFILVPPSKASAIVLAIGVTVIESFMLGEEHDLVVDAVRCQCRLHGDKTL